MQGNHDGRVPVLTARSLEKHFGDRVAVAGVSLSLHAGEVVALLGPNGAGKTTTLRMLAGLLRPTSGSVAIEGEVQDPATWPRARGRIGFLTEAPGLWERLSVEANLLTYARLNALPDARARVASALRRFGLADRAADPAASLSRGMRQKAALARTLLHDPAIVLLDEPTAGLDPEMVLGVRRLIDELRSQGRAILVSTHNLDEADRIADRVAVLKQTLVAFDSPDALRTGRRPRQVEVILTSAAAAFVEAARAAGAAEISADANALRCTLGDVGRDTPALVRALVAAGAGITAVIPDEPRLEDVYLALVREPGGATPAPPEAERP
jgi:ABC-2 type transport system ATP-binding protein